MCPYVDLAEGHFPDGQERVYTVTVDNPAVSGVPAAVPYRPPGGRVLLGPLLTERAFAHRAGLPPGSVRRHRSIPRVDSIIGAEPAYPAFMLDGGGLRMDAAFVALLLRRRVGDLEACDWLVRGNPALGGASPLDWMGRGDRLDAVVDNLPPPSRAMPGSVRTGEADAIREEWLRFRGEETTPGWTIAWDAVAERAVGTPPGI